MARNGLIVIGSLLVAVAAATGVYLGCHASMQAQPGKSDAKVSRCPGGVDNDNDGYGSGCAAGPDCDDNEPTVHAGGAEVCDGRDNNCDGKIDEGFKGCSVVGGGAQGSSPFPIDPQQDTHLQEVSDVQLDSNGDLVLGAGIGNFGYLWVANTYDHLGPETCSSAGPGCRGTISKIDTKALKEVARYFTTRCHEKGGAAGCFDVNGRPLVRDHNNTPSRTAVDYNMDVWVANRSLHGGQPSATKIANDPADCVDRNHNGKIDTSQDQDGNGKIAIDCNGDGAADSLATSCTNGKPPEFLGDDDECILFTTAYGESGDLGRSICLDAGKSMIGPSNAWVGTFLRAENGRQNNLYYKINGESGAIEEQVTVPSGHHAYGCMVDGHNILWSTDIGTEANGTRWDASLFYFQTISPYLVGKLLRGPSYAQSWKDRSSQYHHYGIAIDGNQHVWLGGYVSNWVLRYKPDRTSFDTLGGGSWTRIDLPAGMAPRGIAADLRGKVWVAIESGGYIFRIDQSLPDGVHDKTGAQENVDYWRTTANTVIGVGIDVDGHVWGIGQANDTASRLDVDDQGNVINPPTGTTKNVPVGRSPYTYSDFTGYGLRNFVRPQGRWSYLHQPCKEGETALWQQVTWSTETPTGTAVALRVRSGNSPTEMGPWSKVFTTPPASIGRDSPTGTSPNPSTYLQVEFTLSTGERSTTPVLRDYGVTYSCQSAPE